MYRIELYQADKQTQITLIGTVALRNMGSSLHCMFGDTTVDDWKVSVVFTEDATQTATINGVDVQIARFENSLDEYKYYAIFEYDDIVYDIRVQSNDPDDIYDVLNQLLRG